MRLSRPSWLSSATIPYLFVSHGGAGNEIQLTDAMAKLMQDQAFHALEYEGTTYDCGDKIGLLRANVAFALRRPDLADAARRMIQELL